MRLLILVFLLSACGKEPDSAQPVSGSTVVATPTPIATVSVTVCNVHLSVTNGIVTSDDTHQVVSDGSYTNGGPIVVGGVQVGFQPYCTFTVFKGRVCELNSSGSRWGC